MALNSSYNSYIPDFDRIVINPFTLIEVLASTSGNVDCYPPFSIPAYPDCRWDSFIAPGMASGADPDSNKRQKLDTRQARLLPA